MFVSFLVAFIRTSFIKKFPSLIRVCATTVRRANTNADIRDVFVDIDSASFAPEHGRDNVHFQGLKHFPWRDARARGGSEKGEGERGSGRRECIFYKAASRFEARRPTDRPFSCLRRARSECGGETIVREGREGSKNIGEARCTERREESFVSPPLSLSLRFGGRGWKVGWRGRLCRRERWYVRRIASVFSAPRRFGLPSKGCSAAPPPSTSPFFSSSPSLSDQASSSVSLSPSPRVSCTLSRRRYPPFRASVSFIGLRRPLSRSPGSCHWRQQS